ncbi:MAG: U32 family peptidase [bacterium]|nr:U32 family peptidase [bacterium]
MKIELLAPAKNAETGVAAINCGADAVYISAGKFGARENAGNSLPDIEKLILHAHKFYSRVYIALNTILRDDELPEAQKLINDLYSINADGLIIQDMGLLELELPPIPLIASTQMNNDSLEKILFLEKAGFKRVILPREMALEEIKKIRDKTTIELECFIHGSLCVSYSGQCYLSHAIGGRSANRGCCAQPCRQKYSLCDKNGKTIINGRHILSLKDMNRSEYLRDLIDAGVTSFKIEGRLKDLPYVVNITSFYRKKLDEIIDGKNILKSSSGKTSFDFTPDPFKTFNRGYTNYGMDGSKKEMASIYTPKSIGEKIGTVEKVHNYLFTISKEHGLVNGDGICFFDADQNLKGTNINKIEQEKIYPDKMYDIKEGLVIYRNYDRMFIKTLERAPYKRKISIFFTLEETPDGFKLNALDEDGITGTVSIPAQKIKAEKKEMAGSAIKNQLLKLNDTIFSCENISIDLKETYFIPLSLLNQLRRETIMNLLEAREKNRPKQTGKILVNDIPYPEKNINYLGNVLNKKAEAFYNRHGAKVLEPAAESGLDMNGRMVMVTKYCVKKDLDLCGKDPSDLYLIGEDGRKYLLKFICEKCQMEIFFPQV